MAGTLEQKKGIVNTIEGDNKNYTFDQREKNSLSTIKQHEVINKKEWKDFISNKKVKLGERPISLYEVVQNLKIDDSKNPNKPKVTCNSVEIGWGSELAALIQLYVLSFGPGVGKETGIDGKIGIVTTRAIRRMRGEGYKDREGKTHNERDNPNNPKKIEQVTQNKALEFVRNNCNNLKTVSSFVNDWIKENRITFSCEPTSSYGKIRIKYFSKEDNRYNGTNIDINDLYPRTGGGTIDKSRGFSKPSLNYIIMDSFHNQFFNKFQKRCFVKIIPNRQEQARIDKLLPKHQAGKYHDLCGECNLILSKIRGYESNSLYSEGGNSKYHGYFNDLKELIKKYYDDYSRKEIENSKKVNTYYGGY